MKELPEAERRAMQEVWLSEFARALILARAMAENDPRLVLPRISKPKPPEDAIGIKAGKGAITR